MSYRTYYYAKCVNKSCFSNEAPSKTALYYDLPATVSGVIPVIPAHMKIGISNTTQTFSHIQTSTRNNKRKKPSQTNAHNMSTSTVSTKKHEGLKRL